MEAAALLGAYWQCVYMLVTAILTDEEPGAAE